MTPDPDVSKRLSDRILQACEDHQRTAHQLATLLAELVDGGHLRALGYATLAEYADTALRLEPRAARDLLRIGRKLGGLPKIEAEMAAGRLAWTKARELVRVATPDTEAAWIERAHARTSRALEGEVAHVGRGEPPPEGEATREPARRRFVFEVESADAEVVFRALALVRAQSGLDAAEAEDGALLAAIARRVIHEAEEAEARAQVPAPALDADGAAAPETDGAGGGAAEPRAPSGERYRVVLVHCPDCRDTHALSHGGHAEVSDTILAEAACDAEIVEMRGGPGQGHHTRAVAPAVRRMALHRAGWRCEVPGCSNSLWLDLHHLRARSRGGGHALANLAAVCSTHHRAIHDGVLAVERLDTGAIRVEHLDGRARIGPAPSASHAGPRSPRTGRPAWVPERAGGAHGPRTGSVGA